MMGMRNARLLALVSVLGRHGISLVNLSPAFVSQNDDPVRDDAAKSPEAEDRKKQRGMGLLT
eukprot:1381091-Amphidinium_carterae.1